MRVYFVSVLGILSAAIASAGQIQLGGTNGLTYNYIVQGSGAVCAAGTGNCGAGSTGGNASGPGLGTTGFVEKNYDVRLFQNANESGTAPTPYATYNQTAGEAGSLGQFAMINDGAGTFGSDNFWDALGASTITVPVGINNVTDVLMMLNNIWGSASSSADTQVTFNFGTSSNASSFNDIVVVHLLNAPSGTSGTSGGQIQSAIGCATAPCTLADAPLALHSTATATLNGSSTAGVTVNTAGLFTSGNAYNTVATGMFAGTSGNLNLDSQDFLLSSLVAPSASEFLVNVQVQELVGTGGVSQTALSAITVDTTPEPSTIFMFLTGLGAIGFARLRRK